MAERQLKDVPDKEVVEQLMAAAKSTRGVSDLSGAVDFLKLLAGDPEPWCCKSLRALREKGLTHFTIVISGVESTMKVFFCPRCGREL